MDKEIAGLVAEYMSLSIHLNAPGSTEADFRRANELSWYLGMVMPAPIYNSLVIAMVSPSETCNFITVISDMRVALGSDRLSGDLVASHWKGRGPEGDNPSPPPSSVTLN